jgi:VWFA-related protein
MSKSRRACLALLLYLPLLAAVRQGLAQGGAAAQAASAPPQHDPVLVHRPTPKPASMEGRIQLDVVVTDAAGKPVSGLDPKDFTLLDNDQPRQIISWHAFDGIVARPDPPVEVILLIDAVNTGSRQLALIRKQVEEFLRRNGGHLALPVSVLLFTDAGVKAQRRPSTDGNALAAEMAAIAPGDLPSSRASELDRFHLSIWQLATTAMNEATKPGRKLLIWIGPGWPMLSGMSDSFEAGVQQRYFDAIVDLSTRLRMARMAVYSVSAAGAGKKNEGRGAPAPAALKGVKSARQAESGDLALRVLAVESGGRVLEGGDDLATQIDRFIADASAFYMLSFDPPRAEHANEYHDLKVPVAGSGLNVRTNSGYYNQP